jgi:acetyltransferase
LHLNCLKEYRENFRAKNGDTVNVRFVEQGDREELKSYIRSMSERCRDNRFLSASSELPPSQFDRFICLGEDNCFTLVATTWVDGCEAIIGEACYALHPDTLSVECSLSIGDPWQEIGIGTGLLRSVESRTASIGVRRIFGDVLRSNKFMIRLARKCGYAVVLSPIDWRLVRCEKATGAIHQDSSVKAISA